MDHEHLILIVIGASLRAEHMDRPMGYRLADEIRARLGPDSLYRPLVVSDLLYVNEPKLDTYPTISIGGPGVNHLSALMFRELPSVLTVDNVLIIQMDADLKDLRCCLWGMDHEQTVECFKLFLDRGYLDHFLGGVTSQAI